MSDTYVNRINGTLINFIYVVVDIRLRIRGIRGGEGWDGGIIGMI